MRFLVRRMLLTPPRNSRLARNRFVPIPPVARICSRVSRWAVGAFVLASLGAVEARAHSNGDPRHDALPARFLREFTPVRVALLPPANADAAAAGGMFA